MFKHNLLLSLRYLASRKLYSFVILMSLVTAFVCANLLISFLLREVHADRHHPNDHEIYQVLSDDPFDKGKRMAYVPGFALDYIGRTFPEVAEFCTISDTRGLALRSERNELIKKKLVAADSNVFNFFTFNGLPENRSHLLDHHKIIISSSVASQLFGDEDAEGKLIELKGDTSLQLIVSGVFKPSAHQSHLNPDAMVGTVTMSLAFRNTPNWFDGGAGYVRLPGALPSDQLEKKVNGDAALPGLMGKGSVNHYYLQPLNDAYSETANTFGFMQTRSLTFLRVGFVVCGLVLFIAIFNFINLFLLFIHSRQRDVGIKKTLGLSRAAIFVSSIQEVVLLVGMSFVLSCLGSYLLLPVFNTLMNTQLQNQSLIDINVLLIVGGVLLLTVLIVIMVAAMRQATIQPIRLMSHQMTRQEFSKVLFTFQFIIAIALAVSATTIMRQMDHLQHGSTGFNRNIVQVNAPFEKSASQFSVLKQNIGALAGVRNVAVASGDPIYGAMMIKYELDDGRSYTPYSFSGDEDMLVTLGIKLLRGKFPTEGSGDIVVNEAFVKFFVMKDPVGEIMPGTKETKISGVVRDFTVGSFKREIPPVTISAGTGNRHALLIDFGDQQLTNLIPRIESVWRSVVPDRPFVYTVLQQELMNRYREETEFFTIILTVAGLCIVLSCFGLFALSWSVVESRTREIGIRKVLGASSLNILQLLTVTFTRRIAVAFIVAVPLAYYAADSWLGRFSNKVNFSPLTMIVPGALIVGVCVLTLAYQTIRAARTNPVDELRSE